MRILVQKYGGSSVADLQKIGRVADRVVAARRAGYAVCVVVSAMGKTTDQLLSQARQLSESPPRRELDMLLTVGERTTMALLAIALHARGEDAISFSGSQSGIITNDRHFDARIIEVRPFRIEDELDRGRIVVVAGYQGMSYRREITTLGRGGSDTTAVALAAALGAERCEIYSDVDGVYTADPRVVPSAAHISEMGYDELQEMAEAGAKVLNAEAVEFAKRHDIAIYARKTDDPVDGGRETVVRKGVPRDRMGVRAVVGEVNIACVRTQGVSLRQIVEACDANEVAMKEVHATGDQVDFIVPLARVPDWPKGRDALANACVAGRIEVDDGLNNVSLVGDGITRDARVMRRALDVLARELIVPASFVTTPFRVTALVARNRADDATRVWHSEFIEERGARVPVEGA